jgi:hypothetical protein
MIRVTGIDPAGMPRVYAEDEYEQTAFGFCRQEIYAYVKRRPDTGPVSDWRLVMERQMTESFIVIWRTATHVAHAEYETETEARGDLHLDRQWNGSLYHVADADGFSAAEAKDIYNHGVAYLPPTWSITELDVER